MAVSPARSLCPLASALLAPLAFGCGGEGGGGGDAATAGVDAAAPGGGAASAVAPAEAGPPLTPEALAAYLPAEVDGLPARGSEARLNPWTDRGDDPASPTEVVMAYGGPNGEGARIFVQDFADTPRLEAYGELFQLMLEGEAELGTAQAEIERLPDGTYVVTRPDASQFQAAVEYYIGGRFHVRVHRQRDGSDVAADAQSAARLASVYDASPLPLLADGPDASAPEAAWLTTPAPVEVVRELPPCDVLLPTGEVARICGVGGVEVSPTGFEEEGASCTRMYRPEAGGSGLALIITRFDDPAQAAGGMQLGAMPGEFTVESGPLEVGDGGFARHDSGGATPDRYAVRFSSGEALVEMNVSDSPFDQPDQKMCLDLGALEQLARAVADNLAAEGWD